MLDLITTRPDGSVVLCIVEEGPWTADPTAQLRGIQDRLWSYFEVAVHGALAQFRPDLTGKTIVIRVDAYDTPEGQVAAFVRHFAQVVAGSAVHQEAIRRSPFVEAITFECEEKKVAPKSPAG